MLCGRSLPVRLQPGTAGGERPELSREFGVNGVERVNQAIDGDEKSQLRPAEPAVRRFAGCALQGVERPSNRVNQSVDRIGMAPAARAGVGWASGECVTVDHALMLSRRLPSFHRVKP